MATHHGRCVDGDGHFLEGAEIFIYSGNGFLADVSAEDGSSVDQPLIAGADGSYAYSAAKGEYRHSVWHAGRLRAIEYGIVLGEGVRQGGSLPDSENHAGGAHSMSGILAPSGTE